MTRKTTTVTEEFDKDCNIISRITETVEERDEPDTDAIRREVIIAMNEYAKAEKAAARRMRAML